MFPPDPSLYGDCMDMLHYLKRAFIVLRGMHLILSAGIPMYCIFLRYKSSHITSVCSPFSAFHTLLESHFFFVWTWPLLLGICRHSALYLPFMYPHSVPIETGTLPCDGDGDFSASLGWEDTSLPCFRALNSKRLSFFCKQVTFKHCGMLLRHLTLRKHLRVHCVLKPCLGL